MLMLLGMLLLGLVVAIWGGLMSFWPERWNALTEAIAFANAWTEPSPKRLHWVIKMGNRLAGMVIFLAGAWFTFVASSRIYSAMKRGGSHPSYSASHPTAVVVLSVFVILLGGFMTLFPTRTIKSMNLVWPAHRSIRPEYQRGVALFIRIFGFLVGVLGIMSLTR
jgi:uncharacterized membrane protein